MKSVVAIAACAFAIVLAGCSPSSEQRPESGAYQLKASELSAVNSASDKFFKSKVMEKDGKVYTGESLGCMGSDSDRDLNVTCTGNQPAMQGGAIYMAEREILCNYGGTSAGCKKK